MIETATARHPSPVTRHRERPWHKEPWPWLLMAGPAAVVIAGVVTAWIAFSSADGLVADDYYRRGLAINRDLHREQAARDLGVRASVETRDGALRIRLDAAGAAPPVLLVQLIHPTRAGEDRKARVPLTADGLYETALDVPPGIRWRVVVEDGGGKWRLVKEGL